MSEINVKVTNHQEEVKQVDMNSSEAQYLLQKYFGQQPTQVSVEEPVNNDLTFEEMVRQAQQQTPVPQYHPPKQGAITFDSNNIKYSESVWSDIDCGSETFHMKIDVVSDINIKKS